MRTRYAVAIFFLLTLLLATGAHAAQITITTSLPGYYTLGNVIQGVLLQVTGTPAPIVWTVSAGSLPPGLALTSSGDFSGTPTRAGTFQFTVTAAAPQDASSTAGIKSFTIGVPQITTDATLPNAVVGIPYSVQFQSSDGPSIGPTWSVSYGGLPIGITVDPKTGIFSGTPTGQRTGAVAFTLTVNWGVALATKQMSITINAPMETLQVSPTTLTFNAIVGNLPGAQDVAVASAAAPAVAFTLTIDNGQGGPAPAWLSVNPKSGTTPAILRASIVSSQPIGSYNARIRINMAINGTAALAPIDVAVTLTVSDAPPNLVAGPSILRFRESAATPGADAQTFVLRNTGGGGDIPFTLSVVGKSSWATSVNASDRVIHPGSAVAVTVTIDSRGLAATTYRDVIRVTTSLAVPLNQFDVPVSLDVVSQGAILSLSLSGVRFDTIQGNSSSQTQNISVSNIGSAGTAVNWTAQVTQGQNLIRLAASSGTSTPGSPSSFSIQLSGSAASTPGGQFALIQVGDPQAQGSPQFVVVLVNVAPSGTAPVPGPDPAGLLFTAASGGPPPTAQNVTVNTNSASPVGFFVSTSTVDGGNWLSAQANGTTTSQANPAQVFVSVTPGNLSAGIYRGTVNVAIGAIARGVNVTLLLAAAGTISSSSIGHEIGHASSCTPGAAVLADTGLFENFSVPAGWPATLAVQLVDDCGNALTNASVVATFSNGDQPISLTGNGHSSSYAVTWQPATAFSNMIVTIDANAGTLKPAEVQFAGSVEPNSTPGPSLAAAGFLNNLNPQLGAALAPGTVTQVYGDNMASAPDQSSTVPLPTNFRNLQVLMGGLSAPLFYVSKNQLVIQVPAELAPNKTYAALLLANGRFSLPQSIAIVPVTPGTVTFADGTLVAQRADGSLVDREHPAKPDESLVIYLVGMGVTNPPVASGAASPSDPLPKVPSDVEISIGGLNAPVSYAGLTPGGVGLYQINFTVPDGVTTGDLDVVISQDGVPTNSAVLIVAR